MKTGRPGLRALAGRLGVVDAYYDLTGVRRETSDATREALCAAMGREAPDEVHARRALVALDAEERSRVLDPVRVWREHAGLAPDLLLRRPGGARAVTARIELEEEGGGGHRSETELPPAPADTTVRLALPARPPEGVHRVTLAWNEAGDEHRAEQVLVVAPRTAFRVADALPGEPGPEPAFGVWTNLYTLRSSRPGHWGFGDLSDLAALARACAAWGGSFVGLSPLHATPARGLEVSPYAPTSRLYRSPLYLDIEAVPELAEAPAIRARLDLPALRSARERLREAPTIDYDAVRALKLDALRPLHAVFAARHRHRDDERGRAYAAYREREGEALERFAAFEVLAELHGGADWRLWPAPFRNAGSAAVSRLADERAEDLDLHGWIQFELERQLGVAAAAARDAGMRIGLYADLAVGSSPGSADTWSFPGDFARGVTVGAPPDAFAAEGQDWGLAPLHPRGLRGEGHRLFRRLLATGFRHAGALRIDHVMGFERLFWIPEGRPPSEGAYVRYPRDEMLGILALESRRHRAIVVGEDLGTVPPELPRELASWGILSSAVLVFERDGDEPRTASHISARALASANTHDLAPLAGWVQGRDLELRRAAGELRDDEAYARAMEARRAEVARWAERLRTDGALPPGAGPEPGDWCRATSTFLARTPAPLVGVSLDDLAGETEPVHLPGIGPDRHPGWRRRMRVDLEALAAGPRPDGLGALPSRPGSMLSRRHRGGDRN